MKAIVDANIPYLADAIQSIIDEVIFLPGQAIDAQAVKDADVLIVRTRTKCNAQLLAGSKVRFIATATIGFDHLDTAYLDAEGIKWTNCPGCNASSVGQYVENALRVMELEGKIDLHQALVGIVGVGHVGANVWQRLKAMGVACMLCDPPRATCEGNQGGLFYPMEDLQKHCNVISFHTPLIFSGTWPTYHYANTDFFAHLSQEPILINTSRGEVVDNQAMEEALDKGLVRQAIVDVWENEPQISRSLLQKVAIGTPHIAGYSADGKANASRMVMEALCQWLGVEMRYTIGPPALPHSLIPETNPTLCALQLYDPRQDSILLKQKPDAFEQLRNHYPIRRETFL